MPTELFSDNAATTLISSPGVGATSFTVASSTPFPAAVAGVSQFRVIIGTEIITVTNVTGTTWTCVATAAAHTTADAVTHVITAAALGNHVDGKIATQHTADSSTYVPQGTGPVTLALRAVPSGGADSCPGLVIDKAAGSSYAQGVGYTYAGAELWASALDYENADFVPATCQTPTLRGTSTGDVFRIANTGEGRYGPGVGSPLGQGSQFMIYAGGGSPVILRLTHRDGTDHPVGLQVDSSGSVNGIELWQYASGSSRTAIDTYGNSTSLGFKLVNDPTATQTKGLAIYDKATAINRVLIGVHPSISSSDTMAILAAGPAKTPVTIIGATAQSGDLFSIYDPAVANKLVTVRADGGIDVRGPSAVFRAYAAVGDTSAAFTISSVGNLAFGPGGSTSIDTVLQRISAGILWTQGQLAIGASATGATTLDVMPLNTDATFALRTTSGANFRITSKNDASAVTIQTLNGVPVQIKANGNFGVQVTTAGSTLLAKSAPATSATDGFPYIPANAGAPTGVPTAQAGYAPMYYDTTNHKVWVYDAGWKGVVVA